jgi:Protein of unknown function (DUF3108)
MKRLLAKRGPVLLFAALAMAAPASSPPVPNEQLRYTINWPSGLSLGEAALSASNSKPSAGAEPSLHFRFNLDASVPGFVVTDRYRSDATGDFCSQEFKKTATHGKKKTDEKTTFDPQGGTAKRETADGGKSDIQTAACARDALAFLYYVRHELSEGRIPPPQKMYFGAAYDVSLAFAGTENIRIADKTVEADRVTANVKGPASGISFDVFFLKDPTRTPALVRVPLPLGTFSMELVK